MLSVVLVHLRYMQVLELFWCLLCNLLEY